MILDLVDGDETRYLRSRFNVYHPAWSPLGDQIAFESRRTGNKQIYIIGSDGTGLKQITFGDYNNSYPDWCK